MVTDIYLIYFYSLNFNILYISDIIAEIRTHDNNASGHNNVATIVKQTIGLNKFLLKEFLSVLDTENISAIHHHINELEEHHGMLLSIFKEKGRASGIKKFIK